MSTLNQASGKQSAPRSQPDKSPAGTGEATTASHIAPPATPDGKLPPSAPDGKLPPSTPDGKLPPGTMLLDRYLIGWSLGKGSMGEVYRAQDVKLGEQVALKFLTSSDPRDVDLLLREARLARRISHPNVCRIFDVGEVAGRPFISMEYIDGEDLASLLRRIGRLPQDKALHVAHQLCAGLGAAHERGILHRDLKPANVMLDGDGQVRITDFGLAMRENELPEGAATGGTPVYMAPEQLKGGTATARSDLFALGIILFELFTGKGLYRPKTFTELLRLHSEPPPSPAAVVRDLDPAIERAILFCLESDPARRPGTVADLVRALPGGSALSTAMAVGRTPSPQQVAAAGERTAMPLRGALGFGLLALFALVGAMVLAQRASLLPRLPLHKPAVVLADRAEEILGRLGYSPGPHRAFGFDLHAGALADIERKDQAASRWERLSGPRSAAVDFWYRQADRPLESGRSDGQVDLHEPPLLQPGMLSVHTDPSGRLRELQVVTSGQQRQPAADSAAQTPDWDTLFSAAGLLRAGFVPVAPQRVPPVFADVRAAWTGSYPESPGEIIRIEAAALHGKPVAFQIQPEGAPDERPLRRAWAAAGSELLRGMTAVLALCGALVLAWRNLRQRRGDRAGALRVAALTFTLYVLGFLLRADHALALDAEVRLCLRGLSESLLQAGWMWLFYIALEPYVRRHWPETLISWTRLLSGEWRDSLVWRALLVGALSGCVGAMFFFTNRLLPGWLGGAPVRPWIRDPAGIEALSGGMAAAGFFLSGLVDAAHYALSWLMVLVLCKLLCKKPLTAALLCGALMWASMALRELAGPISPVVYLGMTLVCLGALVRFGLLALLAGKVFFDLLITFPLFFEIERSYVRLTVLGTGFLIVALLLATVGAAGGLMRSRESV